MSRELNQRCSEAMTLIASGELGRAALAYEGVLRDAELENDDDLPEVCGQIAALKYQLGQLDDALSFHERALREALLRAAPESLRVSVYRHFLAGFLIHQGRAADALSQVEAGLNHSEKSDRFMRVTHAKCLWALGRRDYAKAAAMMAMQLAKTDAQKSRNLELLAEVLAH
jgi:hypothetical protein